MGLRRAQWSTAVELRQAFWLHEPRPVAVGGVACAAYALHHALRTHTLQHTALAQAPPSTVILTFFKLATQIKQYKDRILLHLPSSCPVKALLHRVTTLLC